MGAMLISLVVLAVLGVVFFLAWDQTCAACLWIRTLPGRIRARSVQRARKGR